MHAEFAPQAGEGEIPGERMRSALLRGRDYTRLGITAAVAEGRAAIALSRGGAPKSYRYRDPNEDAALFAEGEGGILLAVADGHGGCEAAEIAVEKLLASFAPAWTGRALPGLREDWGGLAAAALGDLNAAILARVALGGVASARTTLALALLRPAEDLLAFASLGDSHVFQLAASEVLELGHERERRSCYLGFASETAESLADKQVAGVQPLSGTRAIVLATDGLSEQGIGVAVPEDAVAECAEAAARGKPELQPLAVARGVVERALAEHRRHRSGDNVAAAVAWP
jgi:serine/threonine protein phosphatase PrpC